MKKKKKKKKKVEVTGGTRDGDETGERERRGQGRSFAHVFAQRKARRREMPAFDWL